MSINAGAKITPDQRKFLDGFCVPIDEDKVKFYDFDKGYVSKWKTWISGPQGGEFRTAKALRDATVKFMTPKQQGACDSNLRKLARSTGVVFETQALSEDERHYLFLNTLRDELGARRKLGPVFAREFITHFCIPLDFQAQGFKGERALFEELQQLRNLYAYDLTEQQLNDCDDNLSKFATSLRKRYVGAQISRKNDENVFAEFTPSANQSAVRTQSETPSEPSQSPSMPLNERSNSSYLETVRSFLDATERGEVPTKLGPGRSKVPAPQAEPSMTVS